MTHVTIIALYFLGAICSTRGLQVSHVEKPAAPARPNILFLMTDSMDGRLLDPSAREYNVVNLPFFDGVLNKGGANFARSYSNNPFCVPSRSSMMTGRASHSIMVYGNDFGLAASPRGTLDDSCVRTRGADWCSKFAGQQRVEEIIPTALSRLGYRVHMSGKLHCGGALLNKEKHSNSFAGLQTKPAFGSPANTITLESLSISAMGKSKYDASNPSTNEINGNGQLDDVTVRDCQHYINKLPPQGDASNPPFFLYCSFNLPHYPYTTNSTWIQAGVNEDKIWVPEVEGQDIEQYHPFDRFMRYFKGVGDNYPDDAIIKLRKVYYAMVVQADAMMGRIWTPLVEKGYNLDNTYVLHVSDHGEMAFEHRQIRKSSLYESSVRVPLQIAGPGITKGLHVQSHLTSLLDIFPTLLDIAKESDWSKHSGLMGHSLLEVAGASSVAPEDRKLPRDRDSRDCVISQYKWLGATTGSYMLRTGKWKLITFGHTYSNNETDFPPLLFNLETDPYELHNMASSKPHVVSRLQGLFQEKMNVDAVDLRVSMLQFAAMVEHFGGSADAMKEAANKRFEHNHHHAANLIDKAMELWSNPDNAQTRELVQMRQLTVGQQNYQPILEYAADDDGDDEFVDYMTGLEHEPLTVRHATDDDDNEDFVDYMTGL